MTRSRLRAAGLAAAPLGALALAVAFWAAPHWSGVAQHAVATSHWPEQRAQIEAAVAAVDLPAPFTAVPCGGLGLGADGADRCWRTAALPADIAADLDAALAAAGVDRVETSASESSRYGVLGTSAAGVVADRVVQIGATRELDEANLPETPFADTVVVHLTADLAAP